MLKPAFLHALSIAVVLAVIWTLPAQALQRVQTIQTVQLDMSESQRKDTGIKPVVLEGKATKTGIRNASLQGELDREVFEKPVLQGQVEKEGTTLQAQVEKAGNQCRPVKSGMTIQGYYPYRPWSGNTHWFPPGYTHEQWKKDMMAYDIEVRRYQKYEGKFGEILRFHYANRERVYCPKNPALPTVVGHPVYLNLPKDADGWISEALNGPYHERPKLPERNYITPIDPETGQEIQMLPSLSELSEAVLRKEIEEKRHRHTSAAKY